MTKCKREWRRFGKVRHKWRYSAANRTCERCGTFQVPQLINNGMNKIYVDP